MLRNPGSRAVTLKAIEPNAGVRAWYEAQLRQLISEAREDLAAHIDAAWEETPPTIGFAQDAPSSTLNISRALKAWGDRWTLKFDKLSLSLAKKFAARNFKATEVSMRAEFKRAGFTVSFKPTAASVESYRAVVAEQVGLIKSIPTQYLKSVQTDVWQTVMKGSDLASLSRRLRKTYGSTAKRAALIARDQNAKAKAVIENTRRKQLGIKQAVWRHSSAGKEPRPTHVAMNGKIFGLDIGMWDADEGEFVWPGQLINCRCTSKAIIPAFEGIK